MEWPAIHLGEFGTHMTEDERTADDARGRQVVEMDPSPWYVLIGGPCSGKTTLINEIKDRSYTVAQESARTVIAAQVASGKKIQEIVVDIMAFERLVIAHQLEIIARAPKDQIVFFDRGVPDNLAYVHRFGVLDEECKQAAARVRYRKVFWLDMIEFVGDSERYETPEEAAWLHAELRRVYEDLGYEIVQVPVLPLTERADFVLARL